MNKKDLKNLTDSFWYINSYSKVTTRCKQAITTARGTLPKANNDNSPKAAFIGNTSLKLHSYINGFIGLCFAMVLLFPLSGCKQETKANGPEYGNSPALQTNPVYHFVVHPLHNPVMLMRSYQPLMDYLNKKIKGAEFILEASRNYASFEEKYKNRKLESFLA